MLTIAFGAVLGGYLGAVLAWLAWMTAGRIARNREESPVLRVAATVAGLAIGALLYNLAFVVFALSLSD